MVGCSSHAKCSVEGEWGGVIVTKKFIQAAFRQKKIHTSITRKGDHTG
jgi:hypothetical protein